MLAKPQGLIASSLRKGTRRREDDGLETAESAQVARCPGHVARVLRGQAPLGPNEAHR